MLANYKELNVEVEASYLNSYKTQNPTTLFYFKQNHISNSHSKIKKNLNNCFKNKNPSIKFT